MTMISSHFLGENLDCESEKSDRIPYQRKISHFYALLFNNVDFESMLRLISHSLCNFNGSTVAENQEHIVTIGINDSFFR